MTGHSLRFRMMFLFCVVVGVLFAGTYVIMYSIFVDTVAGQLDRRLMDTAHPLVADLIANPSEQDIFRLDIPNQYFELVDASGTVLQASRNLTGHHLRLPQTLEISKPTFRTVDSNGEQLRVALVPFVVGSTQMFFAIAVPTRDSDEAVTRFRQTLLTLLPVTLLLIAVLALWYVGRSLRPVVALTHNTAQATRALSRPGQRISYVPLKVANAHDELGRLSQTFNVLFETVNAAIGQLRQFVTDASHELRTPLAVLRGETELVLSRKRSAEEYEKTLHVIENELKVLERIVQGLFTLSMADAGQLRINEAEVYADEVLEETCELAGPLARCKGISIEREIEREVLCLGDEAFLSQLFLIFIDNAVKYSPPNTRVFVTLTRDNGSIRVHFRDEGPGIPEEHLPHIFERFYRGGNPDGGETRSGGLGLAIAQAIANAHGGSILCDTVLQSGTTFTIVLPEYVHEGSSLASPLNSN